MRILIIGSWYAPEETGIAPYTTGLAEHLVKRGHDATVITGMPSYPQWQVYPEYQGLLLKNEVRAGVEIRRVRGYIPNAHSAVRRGLYEASLLIGTGLIALTGPRPDVVVGVVPALTCGVLARIVARRFRRPYALVIQDLTGPAATQSGVAGGGRVAGASCAAEAWAARGADAIGVIAEGFRFYLESLGVAPARIQRVRNWMHIAEPTVDRGSIRRRLGLPEDVLICLHAGNMGYKQGLSNIVECARLAVADSRLLFVLMGDGNQRPLLVNLAQRYRLRNLRFLPIQPAELFPSVLAAADILLVNQRASVTNMSLPGKLTSYFASGRPVLAAVAPESETARELRDTGTGVLVPPDQPGLLLEAVRELAADPDRQQQLGAAGQHYARTILGADFALARLEALIEWAAAPRADRERLPA